MDFNFNLKEVFTAFMILFALIDIWKHSYYYRFKKKIWTHTIGESLVNCWCHYDYFSFSRTGFIGTYWY
ncbi:MAG: Uncharacterised protein [Polaribacter sp. SA4-10]|nr:MAG: Uncharacterised protein [Polaribacter sp. SA4-10]